MIFRKYLFSSNLIFVFFLTILFLVLSGCALRTQQPSVKSESHSTKSVSPLKLAVVLSSNAPAYQTVADSLLKMAGNRIISVQTIGTDTKEKNPIWRSAASTPNTAVVTIGVEATRLASQQYHGQIIYCQVFEPEKLSFVNREYTGVSARPPFHLILKDWKKVQPSLAKVGTVVGPGREHTIKRMKRDAIRNHIQLTVKVANSDREHLSEFKRMVPDIDGFWLSPETKILSPRSIRELLSYSQKHNVPVTVFSQRLLDSGAFLSSTSHPTDVADLILKLADGNHYRSGYQSGLRRTQAYVNRRTAQLMAIGLPNKLPRHITAYE